VAASRVILGLHYVSDVLVGIVVGIAIGVAVFLSPLPLLIRSIIPA
jgi:membrane-associated phospholipid phosphatase